MSDLVLNPSACLLPEGSITNEAKSHQILGRFKHLVKSIITGVIPIFLYVLKSELTNYHTSKK